MYLRVVVGGYMDDTVRIGIDCNRCFNRVTLPPKFSILDCQSVILFMTFSTRSEEYITFFLPMYNGQPK